MKDIYKNRILRLIKNLNLKKEDCILINTFFDINYLTGFNDKENNSILIISENFQLFITDSRFKEQFNAQVKDFDLYLIKNRNNFYSEIKEILLDNNFKNIYCPYFYISHKDFLELDNPQFKYIDSSDYLRKIRSTKDNSEISLIKKACEMSEVAFNNTLNKIRPGISELDVKRIIDNELLKAGCDDISFPTIVASGKDNGALPHAVPTNRIIENGDFVTIDFGGSYNFYKADITRTISIGNPNKKQIEIYNLVKEIKEKCRDEIKAGLQTKIAHNLADEIIEKNNYKFMHSLGHGLGVQIHELPVLSSKSDDVFKINNVFTIEPGIYIKGICGVRIEDDYFINEEGNIECLTPNITNELIIIK